MKIALCISGQLRDYYNYYHNVFEKIINKYDVDVFLHTWNNDENTMEDAINVYKPVSYLIEDFSAEKVIYSDKFLEKNNEWLKNVKGDIVKNKDVWNPNILGAPQNVFSMHYSIFKANELKKQYELENNFKYDIVFRYRVDLEFLFDFDIKDEGYIVAPYTVNHHQGVCDHWAYGPSNLMDEYSNVWKNIAPNMENSDYPIHMPFGGLCAETVLNYHIKKNNIPFQQRKFDYLLRGVVIY